MKDVLWLGSSKADRDAFPQSVKNEAGYQLDKVQRGLDPSNWRPMPSIGAGVCELRLRAAAGAYRAIYLATRPEGVYVLHAFQKKSQKTSRHDLHIAQERFKSISG